MATMTKALPTISNKTMPPNQTLYVRNLPDKLRKEDLKRNLYMLFATYGAVIDIVALKTAKMRGQAHVVFRDIDTSTQAMRALQGFNFCGKQISIQYAKGKSDSIKKLDGTFEFPGKETGPAAATAGSGAGAGAGGGGGAREQEPTSTVFGEAPRKAQPINASAKRPREEDEDEDEDQREASEDEEAAMDVSDSD